MAHYELFIHLPQCIQKLSSAQASESVYMWERVKYMYFYITDIISAPRTVIHTRDKSAFTLYNLTVLFVWYFSTH